ncbi:hypothetical protein Cni_G19641 [Canna indica]|uniref:Uncharacterized protein n=1 Tax=Canna indica TaxID=4628 RepID=A0AAQ3KNJ6_9LILI|nr:hypothetical protein Cni_G19641 [Canna indica]
MFNIQDILELCPGKDVNYEEKLKNFYREYIHADEEIRYCLEGSRYDCITSWNLSPVYPRHFKLCKVERTLTGMLMRMLW